MPLNTPQTPQGIPGIPGMLDASQSVVFFYEMNLRKENICENNVKLKGTDEGCFERLVCTYRRQNWLNSSVCRAKKGEFYFVLETTLEIHSNSMMPNIIKVLMFLDAGVNQ